MKQKLLSFIFIFLISSVLLAQVSSGQVDNFEDGTDQGWIIDLNNLGGPPANTPTNEITGGPAGVNDNYLKYSSTGSGGPGGKMVIINVDADWIGDYTSANVFGIKFDVRVIGINNLDLRVALDGAGGRICTSKSETITAGSGWTSVVIPIALADMETVGGTNIMNTLASVTQIRILSNTSAAFQGQNMVATLDIDNIETSTFLSTKNQKLQNTFSINPNPGSNKLNLKLSRLGDDTTLEVFDVLGKKVYAERLNSVSKSIDVFKWNSGVYLVRITSDKGTQTKRFVKQ